MLTVITFLLGWTILSVGVAALYGALRRYWDGEAVVEVALAALVGLPLIAVGVMIAFGI